MNLLDTVIEKASTTASATVDRFAPEIQMVKSKISANVPIHLQIRGAHLFQKLKMRVLMYQRYRSKTLT
jgi:hypothetical protein